MLIPTCGNWNYQLFQTFLVWFKFLRILLSGYRSMKLVAGRYNFDYFSVTLIFWYFPSDDSRDADYDVCHTESSDSQSEHETEYVQKFYPIKRILKLRPWVKLTLV